MLKAKEIKKRQLGALDKTFKDVRDMVVISPSGWDAISENQTRLNLRKKDIRLQLVKNSLVRLVLGEMGINLEGCWDGPTMVAWGGTSIAGLSKELEKSFKDNKKIEFKTAVADGQQVSFEEALKMPTREEAIGRVITLLLSPASNLAGALMGPGSQLASQIKSIAEKDGEEEAAPEEAAPEENAS